jgi:hypothetical protein
MSFFSSTINPNVLKRFVSVSTSEGVPSAIIFLFMHTTHGSLFAIPERSCVVKIIVNPSLLREVKMSSIFSRVVWSTPDIGSKALKH